MIETLRDVRAYAFDTVHGVAASAGTALYSEHANVDPSEFSASCWPKIVSRGRRVKLLFNHDHARPIGVADLSTDARGWLHAECHFADTGDGRAAAALAREGVGGLSVNYKPTSVRRETRDGQRVRVVDDADFYELSFVSMPRDPNTAFAALPAVVESDEADLSTPISADYASAAVLRALEVEALSGTGAGENLYRFTRDLQRARARG